MHLILHTIGQRGGGNGDGTGVQVRNQGNGLQATWTLGQGGATGLVLESMGGQPRRLAPSELARMFDATSFFWHNWLNRHAAGSGWRQPADTPENGPGAITTPGSTTKRRKGR
jgi:hypothetical protein